jgi:hypothetical protein
MYAYYEHYMPQSAHTQHEPRQQTQEIRLMQAIADGLVPQQPTQSPVVRLLGNFPSRKRQQRRN